MIGLYRVAAVRPLGMGWVDQVITEEDGRLGHMGGVMGSVWLGRACERLREEGVMAFGSWGGLREEVCGFSKQHWESTLMGAQPRPVGVASCCALTE